MQFSYKSVVFSVVMVSVGIVSYRCYSSQYSFNKTLDYYGFTHQAQKQAIKSLLQRADIVVGTGTLDDFFTRNVSQEQLVKDMVTVVTETQQKFFLRAGGKERWEIAELPWMEQDKEQTLSSLKTLGFVDAYVPHSKKFDALCILGATKAGIAKRLNYAAVFMAQGGAANIVILLGGERYVTMGADLDGTEDELKALSAEHGIADWHNLTETHVMNNAYDHSDLKKYGLAVDTINTLRGDLPRPTTQTTIMALITWLYEHPDVKSVLFFSNQPYVLYQRAIIEAIFRDQKVAITFEVAGPSVAKVDDIKSILEGLGSYLWAAMPGVLYNMHITVAQEDLKQSLQLLYGKNPLLYKTIPFA